MNHLVVAPIMLPAVFAALTVLGKRRTLSLARGVSIGGCTALVAIALALLFKADSGAIEVYALGGWQAPFGIVLVLDRLAAMLLLLVAVLALVVVCHVIVTGLDRRGWHFHPLFHFLLLGLNGAFLTGDLFNLFVFFEVLLIASYGLMLHGQGPARLKAGVQYVIINLVGSTIFLLGIGILYGVTGTLNLADMAVRAAVLPPGDQGLLRAGALLLIVVFGLKAALLPLHLWLPRTYGATSAPVAALFAIMTKVGAYAIIRLVTMVFGENAGAAAWAPAPWMLPASLLTIWVGFLGLVAARGLRDLAAFATIGSTGMLLTAIAVFEPAPMAAALYYLPHTTLACAALFLVGDVIARRRPDYGDSLAPGPRFANIEAVSVLYLLTAIAVVGLPPLSGFVGKLLILDSTRDNPAAIFIWSTVLVTTLIGVIGMARAGSMVFWCSAESVEAPRPAPAGVRASDLGPATALVVLLAMLTIAAGPAMRYMEAASAQIFAPDTYTAAVLGPGAGR